LEDVKGSIKTVLCPHCKNQILFFQPETELQINMTILPQYGPRGQTALILQKATTDPQKMHDIAIQAISGTPCATQILFNKHAQYRTLQVLLGKGIITLDEYNKKKKIVD
jgi:hypothetical protein